MRSWILIAMMVVTASTAVARDNSETWIEVRSPNFTVLTDASEKQGRHVAGQLERMRSVFRAAFPKAGSGNTAPIIVIALKNKKDFQELEPASYLAKGQLELAGLFLRAPDKNYVLLRLDAQGEHPYATVYHEYTHLLLSGVEDWLPLWLNEGLAEFYQNTEIHDRDAKLGEPSTDDILYLRQNKLLPLTTLLAVDVRSPYYHEEQKGSVFYAESWALTHFIEMTDNVDHTHHMADYVDLVSKHVDPVTAADRVFGDLGQLQKGLATYISLPSFRYFAVDVATSADESTYKATPVPLPTANAVRADMLAYNDRGKDARALLETVLRDDPKNVEAHETMGALEFQAGNLEAARNWYEQAVQLDSQSYLAHYYFAAISIRSGSATPLEKMEASLRMAIKLNPKFAPAVDQLAAFYGMRHEKLEEAHMLNLRAVALDPGNLGYRLNTASTLEEMERYGDAVRVLQAATGLAKSPEEAASLAARTKALQQFQSQQERIAGTNKSQQEAQPMAATSSASASQPKHPTEDPRGPKLLARGVIKSVQCTDPSLIELKVEGGGKNVLLYSNNYFNISYSASNYTPEGEIRPCTDLEGMKASVQYAGTSDKTVDGQILSVELTK